MVWGFHGAMGESVNASYGARPMLWVDDRVTLPCPALPCPSDCKVNGGRSLRENKKCPDEPGGREREKSVGVDVCVQGPCGSAAAAAAIQVVA